MSGSNNKLEYRRLSLTNVHSLSNIDIHSKVAIFQCTIVYWINKHVFTLQVGLRWSFICKVKGKVFPVLN
jgi:hypothetical protein